MGACLLKSSWSSPTRASWPRGPRKHGTPLPGPPSQPFTLICPRQEPRSFPPHCPWALHRLLLPGLRGAENLSLAPCTAGKCHPPRPKDFNSFFLLVQVGALKSAGLLAKVRHQDLALRTDICKSVFVFLLLLCFSNKDKATRKKGTWNSVKNTQKKVQLICKLLTKQTKNPWTQRQRG